MGDLTGLLTALRLGPEPPRTAPLTLFGPPGLERFLTDLGAATGTKMLDPGFPVQVVELAPGAALEDTTAGFRITAAPTPHTDESVAFRWEGPAGVVGYTGDTGPSEEVAVFLNGCDVLIAECTQTDPPAMDIHLSPGGLAALAASAEPGLLVVTHAYPPLTPEQAARGVADAGYPGRVEAAYDGLVIPLDRA